MRKTLQSLRVVALLEGISFLLLFITMPLKYALNIREPNLVVGMAHGVLFIAYCLLVVWVGWKLKWNFKTIFLALLASIVPVGTFVADKKIFKPVQDTVEK